MMNEQWKMVPVELTAEMLEAGDEAARAGGCDLYGMRREMMNGYKAMLAAAPVPPAGGVEVLGYRYVERTEEGHPYKPDFSEKKWQMSEGYEEAELVDRAHATRFQAEVSALQQRLNAADQRNDDLTAERDGLLVGVEFDKMAHDHVLAICRGAAARCTEQHTYMQGAKTDSKNWFPHKWVIDAMRSLIGINVSTCDNLRSDVARLTAARDEYKAHADELKDENDTLEYQIIDLKLKNAALQSELTKARELLVQQEDENTVLRGALKDVLDWIDCSQSAAALRSIAQNALDYSAITHSADESCGQDAEAAKGERS